MILCMRVVRAADYYGMPDLETAAMRIFDRYIYYSHRPGVFTQRIVGAISEAFCGDGYDRFRKPLLEISAENLEVMKAEPDNYVRFWEAVESCAPFAVALLRYCPEKVARADQTHTEPRSDKKRKLAREWFE